MVVTPQDNNDARPGYPPTREDLFWVETMRQLLVDSMSGIHRAATIITTISGVGLLTYLGWLFSPWVTTPAQGLIGRIIILAPAILWAVAVFYGMLVFLMRRYRYFANSPDSSRLAFQRINRKKASYLFRAFTLWAIGVLAVLLLAIFR
ncbi:hypothetical protein ACFLQW_01650 [Candidatus Zixiibacteriota bacterium]